MRCYARRNTSEAKRPHDGRGNFPLNLYYDGRRNYRPFLIQQKGEERDEEYVAA